MTENNSILKKKVKKKLWAEYYDELKKVKRAISNSFYDVAITPIEKAKIILKELKIGKEPTVKERFQELMILEFMLYSILKNKTFKPLDDKKLDIKYERRRSMLAAEKALDRNDDETALIFLKIAKLYTERLSGF